MVQILHWRQWYKFYLGVQELHVTLDLEIRDGPSM